MFTLSMSHNPQYDWSYAPAAQQASQETAHVQLQLVADGASKHVEIGLHQFGNIII